MYNYINRDLSAGKMPGVLNIEEMATLWHFPIEAVVKAPLVQKAPGRKAEAPITLPIGEEMLGEDVFEPTAGREELDEIFKLNEEGKKTAEAPGEPSSAKKDAGIPAREDIFAEEENKEKEEEIEKGAPPSNLPFA